MSVTTEQRVLRFVRLLGWINFILFIWLFVTPKPPSSPLVFVFWTALLLCVTGSFVFHLIYSLLFHAVPKVDASKYFLPYRLGVALFMFGMVVVYILVWFGR